MEFGLLDEGLGFKATGTDGAALLQVCVINGFPLKLGSFSANENALAN